MWKLFGQRPKIGISGETPPSPAKAGESIRHRSIADIEVVGRVAVATLTATELAQDEGAEQLADLLDALAETGAEHIVLDMQNVQFMDTTCLGCLVEALNARSAAGGRIALASPNHSVHYVFRLTRLDRVFRVCPDVMSAIEACEQTRRAG
jgi:anti-sigma B factor antagonist